MTSLKCFAHFRSSFAGFAAQTSGCRFSNFQFQVFPIVFPEISSAWARSSAADHGSPIEAWSSHHFTIMSSCSGKRSCYLAQARIHESWQPFALSPSVDLGIYSTCKPWMPSAHCTHFTHPCLSGSLSKTQVLICSNFSQCILDMIFVVRVITMLVSVACSWPMCSFSRHTVKDIDSDALQMHLIVFAD